MSFTRVVSFLMLCILAVHSFTPSLPVIRTASSNTALSMGLFDAFSPKKSSAPASKGSKASKAESGKRDFRTGGGARITVREDEDNAMWIEEPKPKKEDPKKKGK
jgi:hypothetical protein